MTYDGLREFPDVFRPAPDKLERRALTWANRLRRGFGYAALPDLPAGIPGDMLLSPLCELLPDHHCELHDGYLLVKIDEDPGPGYQRAHRIWLPLHVASWLRRYTTSPLTRYPHLFDVQTAVAQITGDLPAFAAGDLRASTLLHAYLVFDDGSESSQTLLQEAIEYGHLTVDEDR